MRGQAAVDIVQMLLVFGLHADGGADIVALAAGAGLDVFVGGIGRVFAHGFQNFAVEIGMLLAHHFDREAAGEVD